MSGHSKWSTIKRKKGATDAARGKLFSKLTRAIAIAIKSGGGANPDTNYQLRMAIDAAKSANMPKSNIERALSKSQGLDFVEALYEGFTPGGAGVLIQVATDNKNRTAQELKSIFERGGGQFASPGAVSFNFNRKGMLLIKKAENTEKQMLEIIDTGVEDVEEAGDEIEVYAPVRSLSDIKNRIEEKGYVVVSTNLVQTPNSTVTISDPKTAKKALRLLEILEDHDDVQEVFSNLDVPDEIATDEE